MTKHALTYTPRLFPLPEVRLSHIIWKCPKYLVVFLHSIPLPYNFTLKYCLLKWEFAHGCAVILKRAFKSWFPLIQNPSLLWMRNCNRQCCDFMFKFSAQLHHQQFCSCLKAAWILCYGKWTPDWKRFWLSRCTDEENEGNITPQWDPADNIFYCI